MRDAAGILQAVAADHAFKRAFDDHVDQIGQSIFGQGQVLLVLDNFEQVASFADQTIARWLTTGPESSSS